MSGRARTRLLIVDDEPAVRVSLLEYLTDGDFEVAGAGSAEDGLRLLQTRRFDLAIVDLRLPGLNGEAFIPRAHQLDPNLKFLIITGSVGYQLAPDLVRLGIDPTDVITKPVLDLATIVAKIESRLLREDHA